MLISVICPVLNGEKYIIDNILKFFINSKPTDKELFLIDGGSTDNTICIINEWIKDYSNIQLINNPNKYVPFALNIGIKKSQGQFISRLDIHTEYPIDYFEKCIDLLNSTNADNVGGTLISCGISRLGKGVAHCMSSVFGVGNSIPRVKNFDGYVDSVAFGFWAKESFTKYGFFDEIFIRNQDEEHNFRIIEGGGKIYQSSSIKTRYFVREDILSLIKQMFNYGYYKPKVLAKNFSRIRIRHLIPALFTIYLVILLFFIKPLLFLPLFIYFLLNIFFSFRSKEGFAIRMISLFVYPCMHISYGLGFIFGLINVRRS
jgi:glycosyltransferase involved in cell wall biosynthesis